MSNDLDLMSVLFPGARQRVLSALLLEPQTSFHLRELARRTNAHAGTLARELDKLAQTGIVLRRRQGNQLHYQANAQAPLFGELASMFRKTHGAVPMLRQALAPMGGQVELAMVFGSVARGTQAAGSDVDVLVVGDVDFAALVRALYPLHEALGREVNPVLYSPQEFAERAAQGAAFTKELIDKPKLWVKGNDDVLAELVGHRAVADPPT